MQEQNVTDNGCTGVGLKSVVGKPYRAQQFRPLSEMPAHGRVFLVHRAFAGDKGHNAAWTYLVQRFHKEIIVDERVLFVVTLIWYRVISERHVAHRYVKEAVRVLGFLKALDLNVRVWVKLFGNAPGDGVKLHAVQFAVHHAFGQHPEEIAHAARRLQDVAGGKAHVAYRLVDRPDDCGTGVVGVEGAGAGRFVFLFGQ